MIIVARVKSISVHESSEAENPYSLEESEKYFQC